MPRITIQNLSVAANAKSAEQISGIYDRVPPGTKVVVGAAAAAVGVNMTYSCGGVIYVDDQPISQVNRFPQIPEDVALVERVRGGKHSLTFRNTTGAAIVVNALVDIG